VVIYLCLGAMALMALHHILPAGCMGLWDQIMFFCVAIIIIISSSAEAELLSVEVKAVLTAAAHTHTHTHIRSNPTHSE